MSFIKSVKEAIGPINISTNVKDAFKLTMIGMLAGSYFSAVRPDSFCSYNCDEVKPLDRKAGAAVRVSQTATSNLNA